MKKVLHVVGKMNLGGTESYLMNLYRNVDNEKCSFDFLTYYSEEESGFFDEDIYQLGGKIYKVPPVKFYNIPSFVSSIRKVIRNGQYDVVHAHTTHNAGFALYAAFREGVPIRIMHSHNTNTSRSRGVLGDLYKKIMLKAIDKFSNRYLACSQSAAEHIFSINRINSNKYFYMPNSVELDKFLNNDLYDIDVKKELDIPYGAKIIGHVGRFGKAKNHEFIIKVFSELCKVREDYVLILVGEGDSRRNIEELSKELGVYDKVRFLGLRSDIAELMSLMDVFLLPSLYEGFGIVLLEAQASGVPCIVSENVQPEPDLEIGLFFKVDLADKSKWIDVIQQATEQEVVEKSIIKSSIKSKGFSIGDVIRKLMKIYGA